MNRYERYQWEIRDEYERGALRGSLKEKRLAERGCARDILSRPDLEARYRSRPEREGRFQLFWGLFAYLSSFIGGHYFLGRAKPSKTAFNERPNWTRDDIYCGKCGGLATRVDLTGNYCPTCERNLAETRKERARSKRCSPEP